KEALFRAALGWPFDPAAVAARLAEVDADELGPTMARLFLELWDDPATGASLSAVLRSAMTHEASAALLRAVGGQQLFGRLGHLAGGPDAALRIELAAGQMIGVALLRHVLRVEPIASAPTEELLGWLGPALARYLGPRPKPTDRAPACRFAAFVEWHGDPFGGRHRRIAAGVFMSNPRANLEETWPATPESPRPRSPASTALELVLQRHRHLALPIGHPHARSLDARQLLRARVRQDADLAARLEAVVAA